MRPCLRCRPECAPGQASIDAAKLGMAELALASGVRRFNALFQERYGLTPSRLRKRKEPPRAQGLGAWRPWRGDAAARLWRLHAHPERQAA